MKTYEELTTYVAESFVKDKKANIHDTFQHIDFNIICWIYQVDPHTFYNDVMIKVFIEDWK